MNTCPDFSLLSQFLDHELGREEEEPIRHHLAACPECQAQVGRAARAEGMVRAVLTSPLPEAGSASRPWISLRTLTSVVAPRYGMQTAWRGPA